MVEGAVDLQFVVVGLALVPGTSFRSTQVGHHAEEFPFSVGGDGEWEETDLIIEVIGPNRIEPDHLVGQLNGWSGGLQEDAHIPNGRIHT